MSRVFVITGPSGVGKGTLIAALLDSVPDLELSVSATTRDPRPGEVEGRDYHFMDERSFADKVSEGAFLEHARYSGNSYGTLRSDVEHRLELGKAVVLEIEVQGARQVREALPDRSVPIFIAPPDADALRRRLEGRGTDSAAAIAARLETAQAELAARDEFRYVVTNADLAVASDELADVVRGELSADPVRRG
ncbi:MAG: guanylate kinase [Solirubrobacterales bacterium]